MRTTLAFVITSLLALTLTTPAFADPLTANQIIDRSLDHNAIGFDAGSAQLTLKVEDAKGATRERSIDVKSKKINDVGHTLVTLTAPQEVRGQAFLFVDRAGEDDVWMYLPAFKVTRRVEGGQKNGAFLGSHFTYADLESRDLDDATYEKLPDEKIGKDDVYVVKATPKPGSTSSWSSVVSYIRQSDFMPLRVRFYDGSGKVDRTIFIEKLDTTSDGKTYVQQMTLRPAAGGFTTIVISNLRRDAELPDSIFSRDQLGK